MGNKEDLYLDDFNKIIEKTNEEIKEKFINESDIPAMIFFIKKLIDINSKYTVIKNNQYEFFEGLEFYIKANKLFLIMRKSDYRKENLLSRKEVIVKWENRKIRRSIKLSEMEKNNKRKRI